jgi:protein tyrosine/serine phosphatase
MKNEDFAIAIVLFAMTFSVQLAHSQRTIAFEGIENARAMVGVSLENFEATLDLIDQKHGSLSGYIENQLGFSKEEQQQMRTKYLE